MTGSVVCPATTPARAAAIPAPAIMTPKPLSFAFVANSATFSGVRCAEYTCTSTGIPNSFNTETAFDITPKSLSLPIKIATFFILSSSIF